MIIQDEIIEREELKVWGHYVLDYFLDVLNGVVSLEEQRENILSFRHSEYYTGTKEKFRQEYKRPKA